MNFFQAQDRARRNTLLLLLLFSGGLVATICIMYVAVFYWSAWDRGAFEGGEWVPLRRDDQLLLDTAVGVTAFIFLGSLYKVIELSVGGGKKVAEALGGKLLLRSTQDASERKLLNIVDEMAIAASAPMPDVYLMPGEGVNAFAAGTTPHNAVIGVTRGAVQSLSRDELQGVVAHEFSHIMNGDMRLNIRLIGIIHGIMLLGYIGYALMRGASYAMYSRSRETGGVAAAMAAAGVVLVTAGAIGTFIGSLIRAAVSRQREFLADAAAVQYTRNPMGIAGALDHIRRAPALAHNTRAAEFSHMFFSKVASGFSNPFATHPPLRQRIARILPDWPLNEPISKTIPESKVFMGREGESKPAQAPGAGMMDGVALDRPLPRGGAAPGAAAALGAGLMAGVALSRSAAAAAGADSPAPENAKSAPSPAPVAAEEVLEQVGALTPVSLECANALLLALPPALLAATEEPYAARALIYALLLDKEDAAVRAAQLQHLDAHADEGVAALTNGLWPRNGGPAAGGAPAAGAGGARVFASSLARAVRIVQEQHGGADSRGRVHESV